jgi:hypothetical protein
VDPKEKELNIRLAIFNSIRDNQRFYMNQQWRVIYYSSLVYGAFIAVSLKGVNQCVSGILCGVATVLCVFGSTILYSLKNSLDFERDRSKNMNCKSAMAFN